MPFYVSIGRSSVTSLSMNSSPYHYVSPDGGSVWKGPRKICCFCTLAIVFPALLISVPLLMRFVLYGKSHHFLNPSDMKIVDDRISTMWCQGETVRANTSFTAYVIEGEPSLIDAPKHLTYNWNFIIPDDHKQYWGFYLLKGSKFKIRTCARHRGGTLLVVKGEKSLEYCAYIGEEDSAGNSDEISSSNSLEGNNDFLKPSKKKSYSQEELSTILTKIRYYIKSNHKNHALLKKRLAEWLLIEKDEYDKRMAAKGNNNDINSTVSTHSPLDMLRSILEEEEENSLDSTNHHKSQNKDTGIEPEDTDQELNLLSQNISDILNDNTTNLPLSLLDGSVETGVIKRIRRQTEIRRRTESGENGAFEDDSPDDQNSGIEEGTLLGVVHPRMKYVQAVKPISHIEWPNEAGHRSGVLNSTYGGNKDGSDSESESSFSSSEEALQKCEGVLATFNIIRDENCGPKGSYEDLDIYMDGGPSLHVPGTTDQYMNYFEDVVNVSAYYFFIFGSENEKRDNIMRARFDMEKLVYHLPEPVENCTNVKECRINFKFASSQKVVLQIPERLRHDAFEQVYIAETECHPRTHLYMIFAFAVPLFILLCAFQ